MDTAAFIVARRNLQQRLESHRSEVFEAVPETPLETWLMNPLVKTASSRLLNGLLSASGGWLISKMMPRFAQPTQKRGLLQKVLSLI